MRNTIFKRYIIKEFSVPFFMGIAGMTVILMSDLLFELMDYLVSRRTPLSVILKLIWYKLPEIILLTLPVAVLLAVFMSLGRLVKDSEMTVMRTAGISFLSLVSPLIVLGVVISGIAFLLGDYIVPQANSEFEQIIRKVIFEENLPQIEEDVFFKGTGNYYFYVRYVDRTQGIMRDVLVYETNYTGLPQLISAKEASYEQKTLILRDGISRDFDQSGFVTSEIKFDEVSINIGQDLNTIFGVQKSTSEMTRKELAEQIAIFSRSGANVNELIVDYHRKLSIPLVSLVFVLLGAPLSVRFGKGGTFLGVGLAIGIALVYYVLSAFCRTLGGEGILHPFLGAWLPTFIFLVAGICLFWDVERV
ncbi:MAG TPA: YjgP/YjgQ family permease [Firmicutes bacterium]|nr:YjgP/YjgQ family permease [Bacillota bacterium]